MTRDELLKALGWSNRAIEFINSAGDDKIGGDAFDIIRVIDALVDDELATSVANNSTSTGGGADGFIFASEVITRLRQAIFDKIKKGTK